MSRMSELDPLVDPTNRVRLKLDPFLDPTNKVRLKLDPRVGVGVKF